MNVEVDELTENGFIGKTSFANELAFLQVQLQPDPDRPLLSTVSGHLLFVTTECQVIHVANLKWASLMTTDAEWSHRIMRLLEG